MSSGYAAAQDHDLGPWYSGYAAEQDAAPALCFLETVRSNLRGQAPGHLRHRSQEGKGACWRGHGFIGNAGCTTVHQVPGLIEIRSEVKVGEQNLPGPQTPALLGQGLLDFHDHL